MLERLRRWSRAWHKHLAHLGVAITYTLPYLRPLWPKAAVATLLTLITSGLATATTLATAPLVQIVISGKVTTTAAASSDKASALLDLNTAGAALLELIRRRLGNLDDPQRLSLALGIIVVGMALLTVGANLASQVMWTAVRLQYTRRLQADLFEHLCRLPISFFARRKAGHLLSTLHYDVETLGGIPHMVLNTLVRSPLLFVACLVLLVRTSLPLTLVSAGAALLYLAGSHQIGRLAKQRARAKYESIGDLMAIAQEAFLSIRVIKSFNAEDSEARKFRSEIQGYVRAERWERLLQIELPQALTPALSVITVALIAIAGLNLVTTGQITQQGLLMYLATSALLFGSAASMGGAMLYLQTSSAGAARALDLLRWPTNLPDGKRRAEGFSSQLAFQHVSFSYGDEMILSDVDLEIRRGETVAIVGPSGAGKSTLTDLILRFYDPTSGAIELDGVDIREYTQASYRRLFGVVSQECLLFNTTVRDNITYGRPDLTEAEIVTAARIANAHDFILELPQKYDTLVGDRGIRLSGGQRQRIAIARAIASRPPILVFDEATSALDSESERLVQTAIENVIRDCTAVIVAHRLSTVQIADRIVVMERGRTVDMGNHAELLARGGLYQRLYQLQHGADGVNAPTTVRKVA